MKMIKLTRSNGKEIYVNSNKILFIDESFFVYEEELEGATRIRFEREDPLLVKESLSEVMALIEGNGNAVNSEEYRRL